MTDKEKKAVALLYIAQGIKADKTEIDLETADTLYNLISRQKAEIERLKRYDEERDIALHARLIANAKTEAIKEFANKVKRRLNSNSPRGAYLINIVNDIVKEMTEGGGNG